VRETAASPLHEWALEARGPGGWRRVSWLDFLEGVHVERRRYGLAASERLEDERFLVVQYHSRGGNCARTMVQALRLRERDLREPGHPGRREYLLAHVRKDNPLPHWRTTAELGPLPPERLLEVLELADGLGRWQWGARWWRESMAALPPARAQAMTAALRRHPGLHATRAQLGIAPESPPVRR
jgi:hypothetical protein